MITITYEKFMAALAMFTALCIAGGWLIKIIKGLKKPSDDVKDKLQRDFDRLNRLEKEFTYINDAVALLMKADLALLGHMTTDNNTGEMASIEKEIQHFLINN